MSHKLITSAYWRSIVIAIVLTTSFLCINAGANAQDKHKCEANTKAGTPCQHITANKYCKAHDPAAFKCGASTKAGTPCKRTVKNEGDKCFQHKS